MNTNANQSVVVTSSAQIKDLPWVGNHFSDSHLFRAIDAYVRLESTPREEKKAAVYEMGVHGMGLEGELSDEDFEFYMNDGE